MLLLMTKFSVSDNNEHWNKSNIGKTAEDNYQKQMTASNDLCIYIEDYLK